MDWQLFRTEIEGEIIMRGGYADLHERADFLTRTIVSALDRQAPSLRPKRGSSQIGGRRNWPTSGAELINSPGAKGVGQKKRPR